MYKYNKFHCVGDHLWLPIIHIILSMFGIHESARKSLPVDFSIKVPFTVRVCKVCPFTYHELLSCVVELHPTHFCLRIILLDNAVTIKMTTVVTSKAEILFSSSTKRCVQFGSSERNFALVQKRRFCCDIGGYTEKGCFATRKVLICSSLDVLCLTGSTFVCAVPLMQKFVHSQKAIKNCFQKFWKMFLADRQKCLHLKLLLMRLTSAGLQSLANRLQE